MLGIFVQGERVFIWAGSSGVGTIAIQLAKQAGAWVATTAGSSAKADELRKLGSDLVINHHDENVAQAVQNAGGVNLVIELVGTSLQTSIDACTQHGRVVLVGNLGGQKATVDTQAWRLKLVEVIGGGQMRTSNENEHHILQLIADKKIAPVIHRVLPVEQAAEAHRLLASGEPLGKIVLQHS